MAGKEDGGRREDTYVRLFLSVGKFCSELLITTQGMNKQQVYIFRQENVCNETKVAQGNISAKEERKVLL
jgi:hypothetical protein